MPSKAPFDEAWISQKGEVFFDGDSHFDIAQKIIKQLDPELWNCSPGDDATSDWYDDVYEWMWEHGYGRLVGKWNGSIVIQTCARYPEYRPTLITKARAYCKKTEGVTELECDREGRTLWKRDDVL